MPTFALPTLDATERLAAALALLLRDGDVVELHGEVGAGKTTFTGALARALGSREPARSPTYTVAHAYELADGRTLAHLDCYRATGPLDDAAWGDVEPYFEGGIAVVEWPEPVRERLAGRPTWRIELSMMTLDSRVARVREPDGRARGEALEPLLAAWSAARGT
jgi:tRNA threonylcarbamoyl adenosine modification protein YjeE